MREKLTTALCLLLLLGSLTTTASAQTKAVSVTNNDFALDLFSHLAKNKGNLFFSPLSIQTALAMAYAGAKDSTAAQMEKALHFGKAGQGIHTEFKSMLQQLNHPRMIEYAKWVDKKLKRGKKPAYQLVIANSLWGQQGYTWDQAFLDLTADSYGAGLREVDFANHPEAARQKINRWVEEKTRDLIKDLIVRGAITPQMQLMITNAIYFKATWKKKFVEHLTKDMPFYVFGFKQMNVSMMAQKKNFQYMETDSFKALEMPYEANELAMIVFLPKTIDGLEDFEKSLNSENLEAWMKAFRIQEVEVYFPKFEFDSSFSLSKYLKAMGMEDAFSPVSANFSGMTALERICISGVIHKAFVAVNEEGTTAAAATALGLATARMPKQKPEPKLFKADHPFLFCIHHNPTGKILFMGRFSKPLLSKEE